MFFYLEVLIFRWSVYYIIIIMIIEYLFKRISLKVHQSSYRFIIIDMIIIRHIKFNMVET